MNKKQRLQYLWDYYKLPIFAVPIAVLAILFLVRSSSGNTEPAFYLYLINQPVTEDARAALETDIDTVLGLDETSGVSYVDASLTITPDTPDYDSQISFTTAIAGHTIDVMISDREFFDYYAAKDAFADLSDFLPQELYQRLSSCLLEASDAGGETHVYGIAVSDCPLLADLGLEEPILTIAKVTEHAELTIAFLEDLL